MAHTTPPKDPARAKVFGQAIATRRERVSNLLTQAQATVARLKQERAEVLKGLGKDPAKMPDTLDDIAAEITAAERRVAELEEALDLAVQFDSDDACMTRRRAVRAYRESLQEKAERRISMGAAIDKTFAELKKQMTAWLELGETMAGDLKIVTATAVDNVQLRQNHMGVDMPSLAAGTSALFGSAVVEQLARTGLFRDGGIPHPSAVAPDINIYNMRGGMGLEQAATIAHDKLAGVMDRFETLADATLGALEG